MASNKLKTYKLGDLIELSEDTNGNLDYGIDDVKGISIKKVFIETKADMEGVSLRPYLLVKPDCFAYVTTTSRNGEKITLAHNVSENTYIVSSSYVVFRVKKTDILLSKYLYIYFNRPQFDRFARYNSWGSAREAFSWQDLCDVDIVLPDKTVQQKYVDIYESMVANQKSYEKGLDDLKLTCDAYLDKLKKNYSPQKISKYIELSDLRNEKAEFSIENVKGISIEKKFIETKADMSGVSLKPYLVVKPNYFAYVPVTSRNGEKITIAFNSSNETYIVSSSYVVFNVKNEQELFPHYLMMFLSQSDFDRYARFNSWGSARETFDWSEMCDVQIPIPDIEIQKSIANIYKVYTQRKAINEKLKAQICDICPILIKGSLEA